MCLMCEEEAFFRAYWEQLRSAPPRDGDETDEPTPPTPNVSRFSATAVAADVTPTPSTDAAGASAPESTGED
jgi:hypothetical protein